MAGKLGNYLYYDDLGKAYLVRLDKTNATQMGFVVASQNNTDPPLPKRMKMRVGRFQNPDKTVIRELPAPVRDAQKLKKGATVSLPVYQEGSQANQTFKIIGRTGEKQTYT